MTRSLPLLCLALAAACSWAVAEEAEFTVASSYAMQPRLVLSLGGKPQDDYAVEAARACTRCCATRRPGSSCASSATFAWAGRCRCAPCSTRSESTRW